MTLKSFENKECAMFEIIKFCLASAISQQQLVQLAKPVKIFCNATESHDTRFHKAFLNSFLHNSFVIWPELRVVLVA